MPVAAVDPFGLWKVVPGTGGDVYESDGDNDSLHSLAALVSGIERDWVCIWPIENEDDWENYPDAKRCARANVSNLRTASGTGRELRMMPVVDYPDGFLLAARLVIPTPPNHGLVFWDSGQDAATRIMSYAGKGRTPITTLVLVGHHFGDGALRGHSQSPRAFSAADIGAVATANNIGDNSSNSREHAAKREGPPRCWMRRGGNIWGVGCSTANTWAEQIAGTLAREGVSVRGTTLDIYAGYRTLPGGGLVRFMSSEPPPTHIRWEDWVAVRRANIWRVTQGTL
jgi:hypothetical protein